MNEPTILDLFAGIGGFSLGFERAGFKTIGFSEIAPYACAVLRKHWPGVPNYGDIKRFSEWPEIKPDVIVGGPPCQPASLAGKRRGAKDDRWLWPQTLACIARFQPTFCLLENPLGFLSLNDGMEIERVYDELVRIGYQVCPPVGVPACAVGAGHRRMRIWIAAYLDRRRQLQSEGGQRNECRRISNGSQSVITNATSLQLRQYPTKQERWSEINGSASQIDGKGLEIGEIQSARKECSTTQRSDWIEAPQTDFSLLRSIHGLPARLDRNRQQRIKALGNAIIPQIAYFFAKALRQFYP